MLIFVITTGRNGTKFMSHIFNNVTNAFSFHCSEKNNPICYGDLMHRFNDNKTTSKDFKEKIDCVKSYSEKGDYFESSPYFIRTFFEAILENFIDIKVIHMLRDPMEVAKSYTNRGSRPGTKWRMSISATNSYLPMTDVILSDFQKNLWDWFECEMRYHREKHRFKEIYEFEFKKINSPNTWKDLFNWLDIDFNEEKLINILSNANCKHINKNKRSTKIKDKDIKEAEEFLRLVKNKIDTSIRKEFVSSIYSKYKLIDIFVRDLC